MAYQRKTRDEIRLYVNYGGGWEHETTEDSWKEARAQLKCYRENCPQCPAQIKKCRVPLHSA
jgi:hypothetical protein